MKQKGCHVVEIAEKFFYSKIPSLQSFGDVVKLEADIYERDGNTLDQRRDEYGRFKRLSIFSKQAV